MEGDLFRHSALLDRLLQEPLRGGNIAVVTQEKVDGLSLGVDPPIELCPLAFELHVGFVDVPRRTHRSGIVPPALRERWHKALHPPPNSGVRYINMPLRHPFGQVAIIQLVCDVRLDAERDNLGIKVLPFK